MPGSSAATNDMQSTSGSSTGYHYWTKGQRCTELPLPKRLTGEEAEQIAYVERQTSQRGASAWNHAGTFEERNVTNMAKTILQGLVKECKVSHDGVSVQLTVLSSCEGEAHVWFVRGRKRAGFELSLRMQWEGRRDGGAVVVGTLSVPDFALDDLDNLRVQDVQTDNDAATWTQLLKQLLPDALEAVGKQLKQKLEEAWK